ncbi:hypothetical protein VTI28DRAFT_7187 [Corynascus sepedonium]
MLEWCTRFLVQRLSRARWKSVIDMSWQAAIVKAPSSNEEAAAKVFGGHSAIEPLRCTQARELLHVAPVGLSLNRVVTRGRQKASQDNPATFPEATCFRAPHPSPSIEMGYKENSACLSAANKDYV